MIESALSSVVAELNQFLKLKFQLTEDAVIISNLANLDGSIAVKEINKVVVTLVNIQEDRLATKKGSPGKKIGENTPVFLNLHILISSHFDEKLISEALRFLSAVIAFFQNKGVFFPSNTPTLDNSIEKLVFEIVNQDLREQSNLFSAIGVKYLPSVLYRMRMLAIDEESVHFISAPITEKGFDSGFDK